ncbi:MAG TPA: 2Fe-2S iron-sulfur cluster-binding protein [Rhodanobacteraceae bacterium]|nr:2Fe-2S iron-sulfur cluster-binding protein [Rhodanobacteraceae bacterium]
MAFTVTLAASDRRFGVETGETVLEGARRAGLALPYSCLSGVCGSCKATLLAGRCHYPRNPPSALNAAEQARHAVLLCQAVPLSDLTLAAREVTSVEDIPCRRMHVQVAGKSLLAPQVMRLELRAPAAERLLWLPGQYVDVLLEDGKRRAFSIANLARGDGRLELHVRQVAGGGFTAWVFDTLEPGMQLEIEGPLGTFVPREDSERPMLFVAGGTGFAPIKTIVEHFLELGTARPMHLYWGARSAEELYLCALPAGWAERHAGLRFEPVVADPAQALAAGLRGGLVHEAVLEDHDDLSGVDVYVCGPPALIDAARYRFAEAGLDESRLYFDSFEYAPDTLAAILRGRAGIG